MTSKGTIEISEDWTGHGWLIRVFTRGGVSKIPDCVLRSYGHDLGSRSSAMRAAKRQAERLGIEIEAK